MKIDKVVLHDGKKKTNLTKSAREVFGKSIKIGKKPGETSAPTADRTGSQGS